LSIGVKFQTCGLRILLVCIFTPTLLFLTSKIELLRFGDGEFSGFYFGVGLLDLGFLD
jgi:hypothetical protein